MCKKFLFVCLLLMLITSIVIASAPSKGNFKGKQLLPAKLTGAGEEVFSAKEGYSFIEPLNTDDPVGTLYQIGTTWYDIQHNGTCGHQVQVDPGGWIHFDWMNGLNSGASQRHIFYNLMNTSNQLMFGNGVQVDQAQRGGYCTLAIHPDNRAMPCFHQIITAGGNSHSAMAFDYFPRAGAFMVFELPYVYYSPGDDMELIWPKMAKDRNNYYHIVSTENPASGVAGDIQSQYYCRATFDPIALTLTFIPQQFFAWTETIASDVACSPVSDRVAVGWTEFCATQPETTQYDNDIIVCISNDGINWNWSDTINITNWIPPNYGYLPDTARADQDTLRAYTDLNLFFDSNDVLHVTFSTRGFYAIEGTLTWGNGFIWHWDEVNQVFSMVANGWYSNGFFDPGAWNIYCNRPQLVEDPETRYLYCMYQRYLPPISWNPLTADSTDFSLAGWPNGEIWMTVSLDGGLSWAQGTDITNTHTPNAPLGQCNSELTPSQAIDITNGNAHVLYIEDKDAGAVVQTEGGWTLNPVIYHRVPVNLISAYPINPVFPMHCDSSGMPGYVPPPPPSIDITLTPVNPPIIIPAGGGSFNYTVTIANQDSITVTFDAWIYAVLPSGFYYGPVINRTLTLTGGASLVRTMTQFVPGGAPPGMYSYIGYVGDFPDVVWDSSYFNFTKLGFDGAGGNNNWELTGWDQEIIHNATVTEFALFEPYPNPFNAEATLSFALAQAGEMSLVVYDIQGRVVERIVEGWMPEGSYQVKFNGAELSSGVYFVRLTAGSNAHTCKLLLMK